MPKNKEGDCDTNDKKLNAIEEIWIQKVIRAKRDKLSM